MFRRVANALTVPLIGGTGNQLFQIWRALSINENIELVTLSPFQKKITRLIGWSVHDDWLDVMQLTKDLGLINRQLSYLELAYLGYIFLMKKLRKLSFEQINDNYRRFELGYFQEKTYLDKAMLSSLTAQIIKQIGPSSCEDISIIHDRGGDFPVQFRLTTTQIGNARHYFRNKIIYAISDRTITQTMYKRINGNSLSDFNMLRSAEEIMMTCSTFAFWSVVLSTKKSIYYNKKDNLSLLLEELNYDVKYLQ